jgi:hypothetical protein
MVPGAHVRRHIAHLHLSCVVVDLPRYATDLLVPGLVVHKAAVLAAVEAYFTCRVAPALATCDPTLTSLGCVVDFAVFPPLDCPQLVVIELNPFSEHTGAGLFDWRVDGVQLREGPLELRVVETALSPAHALGAILPWAHIIDAL